jgi:hypothetical protein
MEEKKYRYSLPVGLTAIPKLLYQRLEVKSDTLQNRKLQ